MAKNVFNEIGATYKVVELDEHNDGRRLQETLAQITGARTVSIYKTIPIPGYWLEFWMWLYIGRYIVFVKMVLLLTIVLLTISGAKSLY